MTATENTRYPGKEKHRRFKALSGFLIGSIPYILFLVSLTLISMGFFRYVENQSVLALFLTDRGKAVSIEWDGKSWAESVPTPALVATREPHQTVTPRSTPEPLIEPEPERFIVPFFYIGDKIGTLKIPSVDLAVDVFQGDREAELRLGAGHYTGSYLPGQDNNILIAGHRTTYFRSFEYLEVGAAITFTTTYGIYEYIIEEIKIIEGTDNSVAEETVGEQLTLYTCYPFIYFGNAPNRFVVICRLAEEQVNP